MSKLDLKLRKLDTNERLLATFESLGDAVTWLRERPQMMEVLGVATHGLAEEAYAALRAAARPLDAEEREAQRRLDAAEREAQRRRAEEDDRREREEQAAWRAAQRDADPQRLLAIRWTREGGFAHLDEADERPITDLARAAAEAWIAERNEWVHPRGQQVDEAQLEVWPAALPAGKTERVEPGGQFWTRPLPGMG